MKIVGKIEGKGKVRMRIKMLFMPVLVVIFASCLDTESNLEKQMETDEQKITQYLTDNNITASELEQGFYYQKLSEKESGEVLHLGDVVDFYFKMRLLDGTLIDQSIDSRDTLSRFRLGDNSIVPVALDYGIGIMKVGETFRFFIPSYLAYSMVSTSKFGSYSNFIIEIEVMAKHTETEIDETQLDSIDLYVKSNYGNFETFTSGLYYIPTIEGTGEKPLPNNEVTINFTRKYLDGKIIKKTPVGEPSILFLDNHQAVEGLEEGLLQMKPGGKATLIMPASIAFKQSLCLIPELIRPELLEDKEIISEVLPYSIIMYDVELVSVKGY